jgi:hypothetical protein
MAGIEKAILKDFFNSVLPQIGNPRKVNLPSWDNGQKMFICEEYESASGHRYYCGVRFCDRVVIVEKVGLYHTWTYIDGIELYAFNGQRMELIQKREYEKTFRNEAFIRQESEQMVKDYLIGAAKAQSIGISEEQIAAQASELINGCYKSFLDTDYNTRLTQILPALEQK